MLGQIETPETLLLQASPTYELRNGESVPSGEIVPKWAIVPKWVTVLSAGSAPRLVAAQKPLVQTGLARFAARNGAIALKLVIVPTAATDPIALTAPASASHRAPSVQPRSRAVLAPR